MHVSEIYFWLDSAFALRAPWLMTVHHPDEAEVVVAQAGIEVEATLPEVRALLNVACCIGYMGVGAGIQLQELAIFCVKEAYVDLVVVIVAAQRQQHSVSENL